MKEKRIRGLGARCRDKEGCADDTTKNGEVTWTAPERHNCWCWLFGEGSSRARGWRELQLKGGMLSGNCLREKRDDKGEEKEE